MSLAPVSLAVQSRHRDGLLALGVVAVLLSLAVQFEMVGALTRPVPLVAGAVGAVAIEVVMALFPERSRDLWAKRSVRVGSTLLVVAVGLAAAVAGPWLLATLLGGLVAYLVLLGLVLVGIVPGAESWFR